MAQKRNSGQKGYGKETREFAEDLMGVVKRRAERTADKTEKAVFSAERMVRDYIRKNPERAVFIALGIGALVAFGLTSALREIAEE